MSDGDSIEKILAQHLVSVSAPPDLWFRVERGLTTDGKPRLESRPTKGWHWNPAWALAAVALAAVAAIPIAVFSGLSSSSSQITFDLGPYLAPVQSAGLATSTPAIYQAPPLFHGNSVRTSWNAPDGYEVAIERVANVAGQSVRQIVFTRPDNAVALFIGSPKINFDAGNENWVEEKLGKLKCKRVDCPRMRTVQFPCAAQNCVLVCKACSGEVMASLVMQIASIAENPF